MVPPGDPAAVRTGAARLRRAAGELAVQERQIDVSQQTAQRQWHGKRQTDFVAASAGLATETKALHRAIGGVADALTRFADVLQRVQAEIGGYVAAAGRLDETGGGSHGAGVAGGSAADLVAASHAAGARARYEQLADAAWAELRSARAAAVTAVSEHARVFAPNTGQQGLRPQDLQEQVYGSFGVSGLIGAARDGSLSSAQAWSALAVPQQVFDYSNPDLNGSVYAPAGFRGGAGVQPASADDEDEGGGEGGIGGISGGGGEGDGIGGDAGGEPGRGGGETGSEGEGGIDPFTGDPIDPATGLPTTSDGVLEKMDSPTIGDDEENEVFDALANNTTTVTPNQQGKVDGELQEESGDVSGPGHWVKVNESMSDNSRDYQERIAGGHAGETYRVDNVNFDVYNEAGLGDAKAHYAQFVDDDSGEFKDWWARSPSGGKAMLDQAQRQLKAARGTPVTWYVQEEPVRDAIINLLNSREIYGIRVVWGQG